MFKVQRIEDVNFGHFHETLMRIASALEVLCDNTEKIRKELDYIGRNVEDASTTLEKQRLGEKIG